MKFQAIKGVRDILPPESALWNRVEQTAREVFGTFGFAEIRLPIFEQTELFARSVGQETTSSRRRCIRSRIRLKTIRYECSKKFRMSNEHRIFKVYGDWL